MPASQGACDLLRDRRDLSSSTSDGVLRRKTKQPRSRSREGLGAKRELLATSSTPKGDRASPTDQKEGAKRKANQSAANKESRSWIPRSRIPQIPRSGHHEWSKMDSGSRELLALNTKDASRPRQAGVAVHSVVGESTKKPEGQSKTHDERRGFKFARLLLLREPVGLTPHMKWYPFQPPRFRSSSGYWRGSSR